MRKVFSEKEWFRSDRIEGKVLYFEINSTVAFANKDDISQQFSLYNDVEFEINFEVNFIAEQNNNNFDYQSANTQYFQFKYSNGVFSIHDIVLNIKSYGVGSLLLQKALKYAKEYIPDKKASFKMFIRDTEKNQLRRDLMYEGRGMLFTKDRESCGIEFIKNSNTDDIKNIKALCLNEMVEVIESEMNLKNEVIQLEKGQDWLESSIEDSLQESNTWYRRFISLFLLIVIENIILFL